MPRFRPLPLKERLNLNRRRRKNGEIIAPAIGPSKKEEVKYRRDLNKLIALMVQDVKTNIIPFLHTNQKAFVADASFSMNLRDLVNGVKRKFRDILSPATTIATSAVTGEVSTNTEKFNKGIETVTGGISIGRIINTEGLNDIVQSQIATNVDLIQSIPDEYFKSLSSIIYQGTSAGDTVGSLTKQIQSLTGVTHRRAKLIARDQTAKTNSLITQQRQVDLGVTEYVWQTSGDSRVRATHKSNNGKTFEWKRPDPVTGHPGNDIQCRCVARAIIKL